MLIVLRTQFGSWANGEAFSHYKCFFVALSKEGRFCFVLSEFLFMNRIDSTYADGKHSFAGMECDIWKIKSACIYITKEVKNDLDEADKIELTFDGKTSKNVISE